MKKVLSMLGPHKVPLILSIFFATVNTVMQLFIPLYTSKIVDEGILGENMQRLLELCLVMLGFTVLSIITSIANTYFSTKTSVGYSITLRNYIFDKVSRLSQSDIDKIGVSSLVTRTTNDVRQVHDIVLSTLKSLMPIPIMLVGGLAMAFYMNPKLARLSLLSIPVLMVLAIIIIAIIVPMYSKVQKLVDKMNQIMREKISGIRVIRAFNRTKHEDKRFKDANDDLTGMVVTVQRIFASLIPIVTLLAFLLIILLVAIGYVQINRLTDAVEIQNTIGDLQAFIIYLVFVVIALTNAAAMFIMLPRAKISANRINDVLEMQPEMEILQKEENNSEKGVIEFRNVSFQYKNPDGEYTDVLKNVSFTANPGKVTAIIGGTGSGKSTILNLIPRFYDVADGAVFLDGYDVRQMDFASIYSKIGYIPQQAFLFSGTIADNLRYGKEDATDAELWRALEIAQAKDFVEKLPDGLYSMISQNGTNLSGGQKQRLCIARAIVKEALFYMFDDSFSALDFATDARLRAALKESLKNSSILIVAQRVGTIIDADKIIVLDKGQVVGTGTHEELLQSCDVYKDIVASQLSEEEATK